MESKPEEKQKQQQETPEKISMSSSQLIRCNKGGEDEVWNKYKHEKFLGDGNFGQVHLISHKASGQQRALKKMKIEEIKSDLQGEFVDEIKVLLNLNHPNILNILEFYSDSEYYYLITEYLEYGSLSSELKEGDFEEFQAAQVLQYVLKALIYSHEKKIVHRDLKPDNIMIDFIDEEEIIVKIIDWGLCGKTSKKSLKWYVGTLEYMAPEVINGEDYGCKVDIWSLGVIFYELLSLKLPFNTLSRIAIEKRMKENNEAYKNIVTYDRYENCPIGQQLTYIEAIQEYVQEQRIINDKLKFDEELFKGVGDLAKDLILKMLDKNPTIRLSAQDCLEHPFFKQFEGKKSLKFNRQKKNTLKNLLKQGPSTQFTKMVQLFIARQYLSKSDQQDLMKIFQDLDANHDGKLSRDELIQGYEQLFKNEQTQSSQEISKMTDENEKKKEIEKLVDSILKQVDVNQSGDIDYDEFLMANIQLNKKEYQEGLLEAFQMFDLDKNGKITIQELKEFLLKGQQNISLSLSQEEAVNTQEEEEKSAKTDKLISNLIGEVDKDGDQEIDFDEFTNLIDKAISSSLGTETV